MLDRNDDRTITANVDEVLAALRKNLAEHKEIVAEAQTGYIQKCKDELEAASVKMLKRLAAIQEGEKPDMRPITFSATPPEDHSKEFTTVIKMLELHKNAHDQRPGENGPAWIDLKAIDVQRFVLNDWTWMDKFLASNAMYSGKSMALAAEKGLL